MVTSYDFHSSLLSVTDVSLLLQAISVIVTHRTDDMSRLPAQIATTNAPVQQKPQEARLKLRLNPPPATRAAGNSPAEAIANGADASGTDGCDISMHEATDVVAAADAAAVQEGVGSPGSDKAPPSRAGGPAKKHTSLSYCLSQQSCYSTSPSSSTCLLL